MRHALAGSGLGPGRGNQEADQRCKVQGAPWGDENLKVAVCRMVALGATVAMRRGVWGARVEANLFAL